MKRVINIARDFSSTPGGRFRVMGPDSGEEFRQELGKALRANPNDIVEVVLDGVEGYGSSFLEEAFGGLIRERIASIETVRSRLRIVARSPEYRTYAEEAQQYIEDAANRLNA
jgi:hypothetical protein